MGGWGLSRIVWERATLATSIRGFAMEKTRSRARRTTHARLICTRGDLSGKDQARWRAGICCLRLPPRPQSLASESDDYFGSAQPSGSSVEFPSTPIDVVSPVKGVDAKPRKMRFCSRFGRVWVASRPSTSPGSSIGAMLRPCSDSWNHTCPARILTPTYRKLHRCWVLNASRRVGATILPIYRELLMGVNLTPEELFMDVQKACQEVNAFF